MDFVASFAAVLAQFRSDRSALKDARVIAVANQRGGVGKTTTAVHLAIGLAAAGKRVAVIDMDPQISATLLLGEARLDDRLDGSEPGGSIAAVLRDGAEPQWVTPTWAAKRGWELASIPGSESLAALEFRWSQERRAAHCQLWRELVQTCCAGFDVVIIDTPPSLSLLTINGLFAADALLVPSTCTAVSLRGARQLCLTAFHTQALRREMGRQPLALLGAVRCNRFRSSAQHVLDDVLGQVFGDLMLGPPIPRRTAVEEAEANAQDRPDRFPHTG